MSIQAITTFVRTPTGNYQNGTVGRSIRLGSSTYNYLSFIYQGATKTRSGDNLQAGLALASNPVAKNLVYELYSNYSTITVENWLMSPSDFAPQRKLTEEVWLVSSWAYDDTTVEVVLSSSIDAVGSQAPTRTLIRSQVGALPTTGQVQNR